MQNKLIYLIQRCFSVSDRYRPMRNIRYRSGKKWIGAGSLLWEKWWTSQAGLFPALTSAWIKKKSLCIHTFSETIGLRLFYAVCFGGIRFACYQFDAEEEAKLNNTIDD